ncbi:hypothetical protein [Amycolatopsis sp. cmx-11-12]
MLKEYGLDDAGIERDTKFHVGDLSELILGWVREHSRETARVE